MASEFIGDIKGCVRCGGDHVRNQYRAFSVPMVIRGLTLTHWTTCPTSGEPIIAILESVADKSSVSCHATIVEVSTLEEVEP